jgi:peroxiredoxin
MKKIIVLAGVFTVGVFAGVALLYLLVGRGPAMAYSNALEAQADAALKVRLGEQERFLRDFEANAPGDVEAVRSFGDYDFVRSAVRRVADYYEATGTPIPDRVAAAIESLPSTQTAPSSPRGRLPFEKSTRLTNGDPSPVLSLETIDGQTVDLKGKVVVLILFATWCGPCMAEMPRLEKDIWEPLRKKGVLLIGIGRGHSASELSLFQKGKQFSFPLVADPDRAIYDKFAADYIPRCFMIGKDGHIKYQTVGFNLEEYPRFLKAVHSEVGQ